MSTDTPAPSEASTRDRIPVVALALFAEKGYDATSMREIAEQLGMTKAALYYHFDSKEDIVRALLATMRDEFAGLVDWARTQTPGDQLRRDVLDRWSAIIHEHGQPIFRFMMANRRVVHEVSPEKHGMEHLLGELTGILAPPRASVEDLLRIRVALMSISLAAMAGADIEAEDDEILAAAKRISQDLLLPVEHRA